MYRHALFLLVLALGVAPALAESPCAHSLAELKAHAPKGARFETLNAGQYHLALGMFIATPPVSPQFPTGDGAVLITVRGQKIANIAWTLGGKVCGGFQLSDHMAALVISVNPRPGEKIEPSDDSGDVTL